MSANKGGAPKGNRNATKTKDWERALRSKLHFYEDPARAIRKGQALDAIAHTVVREAIEGNMDAIHEIGNRLDGKAKQHIEAEFTHAIVTEMSDADLIAIANGSSPRVIEAPTGEEQSEELHRVFDS